MFDTICEHIKYSYNEGAIRPAITIFRKRQQGLHDMRVWNQLMIAFAGYSLEGVTKENQFSGDETTSKKIGDQSNVVFTRVSMIDNPFFDNCGNYIEICFDRAYLLHYKFCQRLGWKETDGHFEHLPMVLSDDGEPKLYELPKDLISNVKIVHPRYV